MKYTKSQVREIKYLKEKLINIHGNSLYKWIWSELNVGILEGTKIVEITGEIRKEVENHGWVDEAYNRIPIQIFIGIRGGLSAWSAEKGISVKGWDAIFYANVKR
jgi:hypothetical protein